MDFSFSTEQQLLRDSVTRFLTSRYSLDKSRAAAKNGAGWQPDIWRAFVHDIGILDAVMPSNEHHGRAINTMIICEALGHALVIEPFIDTAVIAVGLLARAASAAATDLIERIFAGGAVAVLAPNEPASGHNWNDVSTQARRDGDHWILNGTKTTVLHAPIATHILIPARTSGEQTDSAGISLFAINLAEQSAGITVYPYRTIDDRHAADLIFTDLRLPSEALLGRPGQAGASLARAREEAILAICAEAVGSMRKVFADTVEHCRQREQFGQPIGNFQVIAHRVVDMHIEVQQAAAALYLPLLGDQTDARAHEQNTSAVKATVTRAARYVSQNAVQLHGAMGMTEELAISHYVKRLTAFIYEIGSIDYHLAKYARLQRGPTEVR
jgi:alkylation response protein AidB-like acyl-CoA dehydrogenase